MSVTWIGKPRRHHLPAGLAGNRLRPGPRLRVSHERHRCNFARSMAALAMIPQDGKNIVIERGSRRCWCLLRRRLICAEYESAQNQHGEEAVTHGVILQAEDSLPLWRAASFDHAITRSRQTSS